MGYILSSHLPQGLTPIGKGRERGCPRAMPYVKRPLDRTVRLGNRCHGDGAAGTLI